MKCEQKENFEQAKYTSKQKLKDKEYVIITDNGSSKKYQCKKCKKKFENVRLINQHIYHVHREKKYKCEKCDKQYPFKSLLKYHFEKCDGAKKQTQMEQDKKFKCDRCEKPFKLKSILLLHSMKCDKIYSY